MNIDYNLYPWQVFRVVARLGSVTRAAEELSISQPAVSAHIRAVETGLGVALFDRVSRRMVLTEVGKAVRQRADRVISLYEELPGVVAEARQRVAGELVVAASSTPGTYRLPTLLRKFERRYPEVVPLPRIGSSGEVIEWLLAWQAPLGIVGEIALPEEIEAHPFRSDQLRLVASSGDPLVVESRHRRLTGEDLRQRPLFVREPGRAHGRWSSGSSGISSRASRGWSSFRARKRSSSRSPPASAGRSSRRGPVIGKRRRAS